jgi:pyridoxal phosphate enzyme (YggS family)
MIYKNIQENYQRVAEQIAKTAKNAGRKPDDIKLIVVTKTHPIDVIHAVVDAGATNIGENYIEEAIPKIIGLNKITGLQWHMVGHVQSHKALLVCKHFQFLHSLDSLKLAIKLSKNAVELKKILPVMLEFNVGGELSKSGWNIGFEANWKNILPDIGNIIALPGLNLIGVMTIPPYSTDPEVSRPYYRRLWKFRDFLATHFQISDFTEMSMGMSNDFEVAIQEGSTWVRIGQAILGPRSN